MVSQLIQKSKANPGDSVHQPSLWKRSGRLDKCLQKPGSWAVMPCHGMCSSRLPTQPCKTEDASSPQNRDRCTSLHGCRLVGPGPTSWSVVGQGIAKSCGIRPVAWQSVLTLPSIQQRAAKASPAVTSPSEPSPPLWSPRWGLRACDCS